MANSTNIDPKVLQDYVATANSGKYSSWDEIDSKFPEFKNVDKKILQDYVATANSGKYKSWDEINGKFPEFFKKKSRVEQAPKNQNLSGTGLAPTQPGDGSKPARFIGAGDQVSNADKDAILKFAQQQQKTTPTKELSREDIQARIRKGQYEDAAKGLREKASVNVLEQAPSVEKGPVLMSEDDSRYQARVEEQRKIEQQFENEKQSVISYLRYSPKDILLDEDALNEDIEYLKKEKGFSDKAIMEGVEEAKRQRQRKKGDKVLNSMYSSTMSQLYPDMDETVSDDQKKKMAEGAVFSKAIQTGVENMTEDERSAYVLLGELKKVNEQLVASPGDNALVVKSAELKTKIGNLLDNPKMLFDPVTGEMVDKSNANAQKYESEVNAEASKMKAETTEDKLAKNYMQKWADFKYWDGLYDQNQRNLAKQGTLGISPDDWNNKKIREAQTLKANWIKAKKDFDVATRSYMLNRDPSGVKRDYGVKAAGEVLLESLTPGLVQDMLPEGMLPLTDKTYLEIVQGQLPEAGIELTPEMKKRFEKTLTEEIVEGAGGLIGILPKLWVAGRIVQTGTFLTGIDDAIRVLSNGNRFEKFLAFAMRAGAEETKTQIAGFAPGVGVGFQAAGETIRLPRLSGKFGVIMQPVFDAAVAGSIGGTVGMELGEVVAKTVDSLNSNQEWMAKMEELFPDFDTVERRIVTNLVLNGLFGLTHIPKGSLTFSPEKLTEMAYKLKDKGMKQEADYLLKRAAELGGYKKIDLQIARGATGVAGRRGEQEQRPVVKPAAPVAQPPAPEVKTEETAPAPIKVTVERIESLPTDVKVNTEFTQEDGTVSPVMGNEKLLFDLYSKALETPAEQRSEQQNNIISLTEKLTQEPAQEGKPQVKTTAPKVKPAVTKPVVEAKPKEISPITIEESINSQKVYDREGEKGVIKKEGQLVVLEKSNGDVIELGNIDQIKDKSISDFNMKETVDIILNDDNTFDVDGKKYVNNYSTPESAISVDKDGNYSVTLDTPDGKKRTFRGERGEEMAYQIKLKQIENERNEQTIDRAIQLTDEALAAETKPGEVAPKEEVRVTSEVEPTKPIEDAVQIETTGEVPVQPEARVGEQVAQGKPEAEPQKVAQEGRPQEVEGAAPAKAKEPAPKKKTGGKKEPVVETKAEEPPAAETKPWKPTGTTKETVDIETLKEEVDKNGRPLSEFKDGDIVIWASKANDAFDAYVEGTVSRKDGEVILIRFKENPVSKEYKYTYLSENTKVIPKPEGDPVYIGPEDFKREKPSPKGEKPATEGEFWTNEKSFSVQPKVGDIVDFDGKKHEVLQKTKVGKEQKYLLKEQPEAEKPAPKAEEPAMDAAAFLKEKLGLGKPKGEEAVPKTTEQKIEEAQKTIDDAAAWLKDKLKINTLPPDTKTMGTSTDALIDVAADAVKQLVATGIKTADAIKQVVDALREGGFLKGIDEKKFMGDLEKGKTPQTTGGVTWLKVIPGKGDKNISARNPVVTQAAKDLLNGKITNEQHRQIVEQNTPVGPITRFFEPATEQQVKDALDANKVKNANKPVANGTKVGLRVDIPAFNNNNTWVVSVHEGHNKKSPVLSYTSVARIDNVSFGAAPNETIRMAAGSFKDAVSKIYGDWSEIPGNNPAEKAENAKRLVEEIMDNPDWVQVGMNPFRNSYFYDRSRDIGRPLVSADQVIQIGGLVYAKNPVYGKWTDAAYRVKGAYDAAGKEVRFSKRTGEPEGAKPVDIKEKEIIDEMNSMELVNKGVSIDMKSTTDNKINTEELNSSLDTPLEVVDFKNYEGIPFIFTISDQLRTGDTVNPFTGEVISDLKGGLGFNGTKGNENAAWANTTAAEGNATVERAMYVYNKNKALFDRLWKEGRLPDGHIPMAVVKMGETSILSNEAVFRVGIQNIQTLPVSNRNKATVVLKQTLKGKIAETKRLISKGADPKTGEKYSENTMNSKKKQLAQYENILNILNQNKYKDIVDVLKDNKNFSLPEKAIIINQVFYGVPTTIGGKPIDINRSKAKTPVSKALIGNKNPELINIGRITDLLTEPSMKEIPSMHIISIVAVDVKNPGLVKTTHPNYEFGPRGKSIGVLEQPIHMKDAFGEAYGSVVSKVAKNEANDKSITPTQALQQGIPVQSGLPNKVYQAAIAKGRLDAVDKLAGFVRQVFPKTTFFTSKEAWETIMADPSVKKQMKDGDVVYGITADGQVYLNPNLKNTKVLLHESGHIWEDFVKENNPKLWEKGESLVSNTKELAEAQKVYGDTPRARSEAIMEIMSTKGDTIVNAAQKADFKEWMVGLWKYISDKFSSLLGLSPKEIENLTLDKFVDGMLADILSGKELKAGKHVADTKPSKAEMAENAKFSKAQVADENFTAKGGNKVVDEKGEPLTVYRSQKDNRVQGIERQSKHFGIYFSQNKESTKIYGDKTKEYHVNLQNPKILKDTEWNLSVISEYLYNKLKSEGYDGAIWMRKGEMYEVVAFDKSQIKELTTISKAVEDAIGEPTTTERQIAEAERTIDNAAAWLKEKLKVTTLPEGTQKMGVGMSQEDLIDLVALAAKKLVSKGAKVSQAIKQVLDSLREGGFLTNMDEKAITSGSRRRMSPSYETDMYKIHELLVDMAKDYIANGGTSRKEFAYQVGVKEKNVEQAWEEANGVRTFNKDQIDRRLADITRTAIMRGFNVRTRLDELLQTNRDIRSAINNFMKLKELYAVVNPVQAKALARRAANVRTMEQLDKFIEYADKVINDANYAQDMKDIRKMQDAAKRVKHTGNTKAVKEFASINPESIPENRRDEYIQALDELAGRVPNYATMQRIYFDVVYAPKKARNFYNVTTFNKASDMFNSIMSNKIESVEDYRKLFSDINGLKRRLNQLVEHGTITMDEFNTIMDQIGTTTAEVKQKFASGITKLKNDLITDIRSKTLDYRPQNKEEQRMIDSFKEQNNDDLRRMEPEDLWELNELIDRANDGNFDYYRWNGVLAEAEKIRRGELVGKQLQGAKMLNTTTAARKLAKQESTFIEGVLGLGRSQAGAVSKYVVSEVERAAGNYSLGIKDGLNELMKAKGNLDKKSMHKIGMVVTYLQEYMAQFNPKYKNTQDIGTRDWFGKILSDAGMTNTYASKSVNLYTLRNQSKEKIIRDLYDSMPKDANGNVSPKAVYESIMAKDGRFLSNKEQEMLDAVMEFIDKEVKPKQESANFSRGMDFEALSFYMPRIDLKQRGDIEAKVETNRNRVRIKSGFGEERTSQKVRPIEVDFESAITSAIEAANRDYYFGKALDMVSGTLGYAAKQGDVAKNAAEILATNIKDMMEFEFARKQSDAAAALSGLALGARAAQTLLNPIRTVMVELPATYIQVPLRSRNVSGYVDIINPTNGKLFRELLDYSESPLRLRENISSAIDIDQGAIKPQSFKDKALVFLAGAPERITMIGSWMPTFKNEFFKLTGEKFDGNKFSSDPNYRKKFNRAIKEAATSADMTTQKIIGVTTKLSQARQLELPGEGTLYQKGVSKDEILGKTLGFFGNYPRREYLEFINGFKEINERYRAGEGAASLTSISKPLSVAIGTLTYGYMSSLVYTLTKAYFGTEDEKKKAQEELERLNNTQGVVEEGISQGIALAGSKYYAAGRIATSLLTLAAYNMTEDPERKKNIGRMYKNTYYADPIDPDGSKAFLSKDNKEKMALWIIKTAIPQFALVVDKYQQGLEAYGGFEKLMDRYDEVGFSGLADEERDLWLLGDIILKTGGIVANLYGTAIPMEKTLQMYVRGQYEAVPLSKDDVREEMQRRIDTRTKTPEERKETFEERIKRRKREMELRKLSKEYGIPYVKPR